MEDAHRVRLERLRWHCRRALLELDIVFQRFWSRTGDELDEEEAALLEGLLAMEDHELWELVSGRSTSGDPRTQVLVERLRQA